jgi:DNA-binding winged helix-turn-helix (wHTH) protein
MQYAFVDCVLDTERRELRRASMPVKLEPKVYQVLVYLVQHADRMVTREELFNHVWPEVYVAHTAVARCITTIRQAIGDSAEAQRVIQTRHGQGYRFVAPVTVYEAIAPPAEGLQPSSGPPALSAAPLERSTHTAVPGLALQETEAPRHLEARAQTGAPVALLYMRHVQPDTQVLKHLEAQLSTHGYNVAHLESVDTLYLTLGGMLAEQLDLAVFPEDVWQARRGPNGNFERYVRREVLGTLSTPLVWGLDEVDRLFTYAFGHEIFGLFRAWHNERALDPQGPWGRLTLAIAYATEAHLFITDPHQSPFNVGTRLALEDFTCAQVADLNRRYGSPLRDAAEVERLFRLVGGQPYLIRRGLHELVTQHLTIAALEDQAAREEGLFGDHLRRLLVLLAPDPALCDAVREVLQGRPCPDYTRFYRLRSAGILAGESPQDARPRCQLYATYLERHLR